MAVDLRYCTGWEVPTDNGTAFGYGNDFCFSPDAARWGRYGYPSREFGRQMSVSGTLGTLPYCYVRFWMRPRSFPVGGSLLFFRNQNSLGSTRGAILTLDSAGALRAYAMGSAGTFASKTELSAYVPSYAAPILALHTWYMVEWYQQWGNTDSGGSVTLLPRVRLLVITDASYAHQGWGGALSASPFGWSPVTGPNQGRTTGVELGQMAPQGDGTGMRIDFDGFSIEGLIGDETTVGSDVTPAPFSSGSNPRMFTPTLLSRSDGVFSAVSAGSWALVTAGGAPDSLFLSVTPASTVTDTMRSTTSGDTLTATVGVPADHLYGAPVDGIIHAAHFEQGDQGQLGLTIGGNTYDKAPISGGTFDYAVTNWPTPGAIEVDFPISVLTSITARLKKSANVNPATWRSLAVQLVSPTDYTIADDTTGTVTCATGTYTGNGVSHHVAVGWQPDWIWVGTDNGATPGVHWTDQMVMANGWTQKGAYPLRDTPTGFLIVGADSRVNTNGTTYRWFAIKDAQKRLLYRGAFCETDTSVTTFTLDGSAVVPLSFGTVGAVWVHNEGFQSPGGAAGFYRGAAHTGTNSTNLSTASVVTTGIRSFPAPGSGFVIGSSLITNNRPQSAFTIWGLNFFGTHLWDVKTYTGTGAATQAIPVDLSGVAPAWALILDGQGNAFVWQDHLAGTAAQLLGSSGTTNNVVASVAADLITVGINANANGRTYDLIVLRPGEDVAPGCGPFTDAQANSVTGETLTLGPGADSGGGSGQRPSLGPGSDSGGGSGYRLSL